MKDCFHRPECWEHLKVEMNKKTANLQEPLRCGWRVQEMIEASPGLQPQDRPSRDRLEPPGGTVVWQGAPQNRMCNVHNERSAPVLCAPLSLFLVFLCRFGFSAMFFVCSSAYSQCHCMFMSPSLHSFLPFVRSFFLSLSLSGVSSSLSHMFSCPSVLLQLHAPTVSPCKVLMSVRSSPSLQLSVSITPFRCHSVIVSVCLTASVSLILPAFVSPFLCVFSRCEVGLTVYVRMSPLVLTYGVRRSGNSSVLRVCPDSCTCGGTSFGSMLERSVYGSTCWVGEMDEAKGGRRRCIQNFTQNDLRAFLCTGP